MSDLPREHFQHAQTRLGFDVGSFSKCTYYGVKVVVTLTGTV